MIPGTTLMKVRNNLRLLPNRVIKDAVHDRRILYSYGAKTFGFDPILQKGFLCQLLGHQR